MTPVLALSDAVWLGLIGVIAMAVKEFFDRQRKQDSDRRDDLIAERAAKVVTALETTDAETTKRFDGVDAGIKEVHTLTNGMSKRLEETAEAKGILQGGADERARADERAAKGDSRTNL